MVTGDEADVSLSKMYVSCFRIMVHLTRPRVV